MCNIPPEGTAGFPYKSLAFRLPARAARNGSRYVSGRRRRYVPARYGTRLTVYSMLDPNEGSSTVNLIWSPATLPL